MAGTIPPEALGLAIFVDVLTVFATILGLILCSMLWNHGERVSYILLLSASTTIGAINGLIRYLDYTLNWREIQIQRFENEQHHSYSQSDMFRKADVGWRLVLSWISIFTYNVDALLILFWSIALFIGTWDIRITSPTKKIMSIVFKTSALVLPAIMCVVCSIEAIENTPVAYLVIFNFIMLVCLTTGSLLVIIVLLKYIQSRNIFDRFFPKSTVVSTSLGVGTVTSVATAQTRSATDKWLIVRFSIIMICLLVFEAAQIIYQLVNYERNRHGSKTVANSPDFTAEQARIDLAQHIPATLPSIIAFLIFGTTAPFRRKYAQILRAIFCCSTLHKRRAQKNQDPWVMLQPRPQDETSRSSLPEEHELEAQEKPAAAISVRTEISQSSVSSIGKVAGNTPNTAVRPVSKEQVRMSFGGTTLSSQDEPTTPSLAYNNPSSRSPTSPMRMHSQTFAPMLRVDSGSGTPDDMLSRNQAWSSHSRQTSNSHSRRPSTAASRQASIWDAPTTPPRTRASPLLPDLITTSPPTATHRRIPSATKIPRSSKDDPLYQRPMQSPKLRNIPPVPSISAPHDWQRDSTTTIESARFSAGIARGSMASQAPLISSSPQRASADESSAQYQGRGEQHNWLGESAGCSSETPAARSGTTAPNPVSAFDFGFSRNSSEDNNNTYEGLAAQCHQHRRNRSNSEVERLSPSIAPQYGSAHPAAVIPPGFSSSGGWI